MNKIYLYFYVNHSVTPGEPGGLNYSQILKIVQR
jgi:hypothetical protein